jgi:hypothetical protein
MTANDGNDEGPNGPEGTAQDQSDAAKNAPEVGKGKPNTAYSDPDGGKAEFRFSNDPEPKND